MAVYCAILEGMSIGFAAIYLWSLGEGRRHHPLPAHARRSAWWRFSAGSLVYVVALIVAFASPPASLAIVGLVAAYYIVERGAGGAQAL